MKIKISELRNLMVKLVSSKYYTKKEALSIVEPLIWAEISGKNTQGILKLLGSEPYQDIKPIYKPKVIKKAQLSTLIDGGKSAAPLVAQMATDKVIKIATNKGFGIVGVNNTFSSVGSLGYYARKIAKANLIGIVMASSPKAINHFGGIDPVYGTNPIAFGFPTNEYPITFDMASSAITWYGLVRAKALGEKIPENVAINKDGNITTDPTEAMDGAILPFDRSYKGSGLAMSVEILSGILPGAGYVLLDEDWGTTMIAISPDLLTSTKEFKRKSSDLIKKVKAGRTLKGQKIVFPGYDKEEEIKKILKKNEIEIEDKLLKDLKSRL